VTKGTLTSSQLSESQLTFSVEVPGRESRSHSAKEVTTGSSCEKRCIQKTKEVFHNTNKCNMGSLTLYRIILNSSASALPDNPEHQRNLRDGPAQKA